VDPSENGSGIRIKRVFYLFHGRAHGYDVSPTCVIQILSRTISEFFGYSILLAQIAQKTENLFKNTRMQTHAHKNTKPRRGNRRRSELGSKRKGCIEAVGLPTDILKRFPVRAGRL